MLTLITRVIVRPLPPLLDPSLVHLLHRKPSPPSTPSDLQPQHPCHHTLQGLSSSWEPFPVLKAHSLPLFPNLNRERWEPPPPPSAIQQPSHCPCLSSPNPSLRPSGALNACSLSHSPAGLPGPPTVRAGRAGSAFLPPVDSHSGNGQSLF